MLLTEAIYTASWARLIRSGSQNTINTLSAAVFSAPKEQAEGSQWQAARRSLWNNDEKFRALKVARRCPLINRRFNSLAPLQGAAGADAGCPEAARSASLRACHWLPSLRP